MGDVVAQELDGAAARHEPADRVHEARLAGAVGADESDHGAEVHGEAHVVDRRDPAEVDGEVLDVQRRCLGSLGLVFTCGLEHERQAVSYLGQETGAALAAVLFGDVDASGRLTTTYPRRLEDSPAVANFPGRDGTVEYAEGVFVGYRHYDAHGVDPRWCFGHGLSYTTFAYSSLTRRGRRGPRATTTRRPAGVGRRHEHRHSLRERGRPGVRAEPSTPWSPMPDRELEAFEKVSLEPGETTTVTVALDQRAFAYWDTEHHAWRVSPGAYEILVGSSSRAIHQTAVWTDPRL